MMADFKSLREFEIEDDDMFGWGVGDGGEADEAAEAERTAES